VGNALSDTRTSLNVSGLSKTYPTIVFAPSQVHRVADHVADGTPEDSSLNDPSLDWSEPSDLKAVVMNDVSHERGLQCDALLTS